MPITVEDLLIGPRGRRFLLELAVRCDTSDRLPDALFETVWASFSQPGSMYAELSEVDESEGGVEDAGESDVNVDVDVDVEDQDGTRPAEAVLPGEHPDPTAVADPTAAGFAALLAETVLRDPSPADQRLALTAAVDAVRYWQAPDGEDALAADPAMRPALARVAEHALPHLPAWWSGPLGADVEHVLVEFEDEDRPPEQPADAAGIARALRDDLREEAANESCWWSTPPAAVPSTSTVRPGADGTIEIPGLLYVEDGSGWARAETMPAYVPADARVLTIDGPEDWGRLCRSHPLPKGEAPSLRRRATGGLRRVLGLGAHAHAWTEATGRAGAWAMPDWAAIAREVDAVHLTVRGYLTTAGRALPVDERTATVLAGFSPDQTIRFAPVDVDRDRAQAWELDDDDQETWAPVA